MIDLFFFRLELESGENKMRLSRFCFPKDLYEVFEFCPYFHCRCSFPRLSVSHLKKNCAKKNIIVTKVIIAQFF